MRFHVCKFVCGWQVVDDGSGLRGKLIEWIYNCQVPPSRAHAWQHCGFKGGPCMGQPFASNNADNDSEAGYVAHAADQAHLAMTYTSVQAPESRHISFVNF